MSDNDNDNITTMAEHSAKAKHWSIEQMLQEELDDYKAGDMPYNKAIILYLDDKDQKFNIGYSAAGFVDTTSIIAVLEAMKLEFLNKMNILPRNCPYE